MMTLIKFEILDLKMYTEVTRYSLQPYTLPEITKALELSIVIILIDI